MGITDGEDDEDEDNKRSSARESSSTDSSSETSIESDEGDMVDENAVVGLGGSGDLRPKRKCASDINYSITDYLESGTWVRRGSESKRGRSKTVPDDEELDRSDCQEDEEDGDRSLDDDEDQDKLDEDLAGLEILEERPDKVEENPAGYRSKPFRVLFNRQQAT